MNKKILFTIAGALTLVFATSYYYFGFSLWSVSLIFLISIVLFDFPTGKSIERKSVIPALQTFSYVMVGMSTSQVTEQYGGIDAVSKVIFTDTKIAGFSCLAIILHAYLVFEREGNTGNITSAST